MASGFRWRGSRPGAVFVHPPEPSHIGMHFSGCDELLYDQNYCIAGTARLTSSPWGPFGAKICSSSQSEPRTSSEG
jgi:hypothetical protein